MSRRFKSKVPAAVSILFLIAASRFLLLSTQEYENGAVHLEPSHNSTAVIASSEHQQSNNSLSFGSPFVVVTEGGCSGTGAVGKYIGSIVKRHGFNRTKGVAFEFLHVNGNDIYKLNPNKQNKKIYKNPYFQDIVRERNITVESGFGQQYFDLVQESVQRAQTVAIETKTLLYFKSNVKRSLRLRSRFEEALEGRVSYAGLYQENALDRCICMVRDCFYEGKRFGTAVFGHNGTETDLCIQRRQHPEWDVRAKFTNVVGCLEEDQNRVNMVRGQGFDSFTSDELLRFETSVSGSDFQSSVDAWVHFLRPLLQGALDREIVANALEEGRGTRPPGTTSSQESKVYNYAELKEELIGSQKKWDSFLRD